LQWRRAQGGSQSGDYRWSSRDLLYYYLFNAPWGS
jgi:hypothetical protein